MKRITNYPFCYGGNYTGCGKCKKAIYNNNFIIRFFIPFILKTVDIYNRIIDILKQG